MIDIPKPFITSMLQSVNKVLTPYYRNIQAFETKHDCSPVTEADKGVETALRALIEQSYPEHGIQGEEFGITNEEAPYRWFIDPIDGTLSFLIGRPTFGTLVALTHQDQPIWGMIYQPITKDCWAGRIDQTNKQATLNDAPITTRQCETIDTAVIATTGPNYFTEQEKVLFEKIANQAQYQLYGGDCYSYGLLASGFVDIVIEAGLKPHDYMAMVPVVEAAGGIMTDWQGNPLTSKSDGRVVACGTQPLHTQLISMLQGA